MERPTRHPTRSGIAPLLAALLAPLLSGGCTAEGPEADDRDGEAAAVRDTTRSFQGHRFERNVVFLTTREDSTIVVPWLVTARTRPGGVDRTARGALARNGSWEVFFQSSWETPPTRVPWRILPRESMRLIVGDEEDLDRIVYEEGARQLHVTLERGLVEWGGQRGETFRLMDGSLLLSNQRVPGVVLDMTRARRAEDGPAGDWAVLVSGDSLQVVLHSPDAVRAGSTGAWRGWARLGYQEFRWPSVTVDWSQTRAFERARREVPAGWTLSGELEGTLEATAAQLQAGEGEGPQLPVDGLFEVAGTLRFEGNEYAVWGLVRHEQR